MEGSRPLDQQVIVEAGRRLVERAGAKALTMRMLADELGVSTMAAYRHVPNKSALLLLIADAALAEVQVPPPRVGGWEARLRALERDAFHQLLRVADLWDLIPTAAIFPSRERLASAVVGILLDAGFDPRAAALAHETIWSYVIGQLKVRELLLSGTGRRRRSVRRTGDTTEVLLGSVVISGRVQAIGIDEYFDFGLRTILTGLREELAAASGPATAGTPG